MEDNIKEKMDNAIQSLNSLQNALYDRQEETDDHELDAVSGEIYKMISIPGSIREDWSREQSRPPLKLPDNDL